MIKIEFFYWKMRNTGKYARSFFGEVFWSNIIYWLHIPSHNFWRHIWHICFWNSFFHWYANINSNCWMETSPIYTHARVLCVTFGSKITFSVLQTDVSQNDGGSIRRPPKHLSTIVLWWSEGFGGALSWTPIMSKGASLSDSYTCDRCCLSDVIRKSPTQKNDQLKQDAD